MARKRIHKRYGRSRRIKRSGAEPRHNPSGGLGELAEFVVPGFGAFALTRFFSRIAAVQVARKKPTWGKHVGALTSLLSVAAAYYGAPRVQKLGKYEMPLLVGSSIAALQTLIQTYIPKLGWMLADATPQLLEERAGSLNVQISQPTGSAQSDLLVDTGEDPSLYTYNDSFDAGRVQNSPETPIANAAGADPAINDDLTVGLGDLDLGSLSQN